MLYIKKKKLSFVFKKGLHMDFEIVRDDWCRDERLMGENYIMGVWSLVVRQ